MDNSRLFIANLSKGKIGHDKANLLGSLLVTQFQLAAMRRAGQPEDERRDFFLFIDEFQNFTTDAFASLLAEARKYRLCLILSHQYVDQLSPEIRQAVFGNAGTMMTFRIGHTDAELLAKEFANTFIPAQFVELDRYQVFTRLLENGIASTPFPAKTLPALGVSKNLRQNLCSQRRYSSKRVLIEARIQRWLQNAPSLV